MELRSSRLSYIEILAEVINQNHHAVLRKEANYFLEMYYFPLIEESWCQYNSLREPIAVEFKYPYNDIPCLNTLERVSTRTAIRYVYRTGHVYFNANTPSQDIFHILRHDFQIKKADVLELLSIHMKRYLKTYGYPIEKKIKSFSKCL